MSVMEKEEEGYTMQLSEFASSYIFSDAARTAIIGDGGKGGGREPINSVALPRGRVERGRVH
jgi:hypothetical protein